MFAGAGESPGLVAALRQLGTWDVQVFMKSPTRRFGWIKDAADLSDFAGESGTVLDAFDAAIDASHPFDEATTRTVTNVCTKAGIRLAYFQRPVWTPKDGDRWQVVPQVSAALSGLSRDARIFATTGRESEETLAGTPAQVYLRQLSSHTDPPKGSNIRYVFGEGPFSEDHERDLFLALGITHCLFRNTGGEAGCTKLWAARRLGVPVFMLQRPPMPTGVHLTTIDAALAWLKEGS